MQLPTWQDRVERARRRHLPGDILVLAGEAPSPAQRAAALCAAGDSLLELGNAEFALEQFDAALAIAPQDPQARALRARCLARIAGAAPMPGAGPVATGFAARQVLLFSGHIVDAPQRASARFPAAKEAAAARRIAQTLDALEVHPADLAFSQAAAGGDLLFLEACLQRGVHCHVLLPLEEDEFIAASILPAAQGPLWRERYRAVLQRLPEPARSMPQELGAAPAGADAFERCNLWLLYSALAWGAQRLRFICLWDGSGGDGPGGTRHMHDQVLRRAGRVSWIDTREL